MSKYNKKIYFKIRRIKKKKTISFLFLPFFLFGFTTLLSQSTLKYSGDYKGGKAEYEYYVKEDKRVFHGKCTYSDEEFDFSGNYSHGVRVGQWTKTKVRNFYTKNNSTITLDCFVEYFQFNDEGELHGEYKKTHEFLDYKGDKLTGKFTGQEFIFNYKNGNLNGDFYLNSDLRLLKENPEFIKGSINKSGYIDGDLVVNGRHFLESYTYDGHSVGTYVIINQEFDNGVLIKSSLENPETGEVSKHSNKLYTAKDGVFSKFIDIDHTNLIEYKKHVSIFDNNTPTEKPEFFIESPFDIDEVIKIPTNIENVQIELPSIIKIIKPQYVLSESGNEMLVNSKKTINQSISSYKNIVRGVQIDINKNSFFKGISLTTNNSKIIRADTSKAITETKLELLKDIYKLNRNYVLLVRILSDKINYDQVYDLQRLRVFKSSLSFSTDSKVEDLSFKEFPAYFSNTEEFLLKYSQRQNELTESIEIKLNKLKKLVDRVRVEANKQEEFESKKDEVENINNKIDIELNKHLSKSESKIFPHLIKIKNKEFLSFESTVENSKSTDDKIFAALQWSIYLDSLNDLVSMSNQILMKKNRIEQDNTVDKLFVIDEDNSTKFNNTKLFSPIYETYIPQSMIDITKSSDVSKIHKLLSDLDQVLTLSEFFSKNRSKNLEKSLKKAKDKKEIKELLEKEYKDNDK